MKTCFIFNPCSGHNRRNPWLATAIPDFIARHGLDARLAVTERPGHATELARRAVDDGCTRVVAVGGDGTLNEVAQALVGTDAALALVPCGSGNGLALHLGIPTRPRRALELLAGDSAKVATIDTGAANGHAFFNVMGLGFDAEISRRFNQLSRRGLPAYAKTALAAYLKFEPEFCEIITEKYRESIAAFLIAIANSDQYGNNARIAPGARIDDGHLDLVALRPLGALRALALAPRLFLGNIHLSSRVHHRRSRHFTIHREARGIIHTDGETHETDATIEIVTRPASLRILVPAGLRVQTPAPVIGAPLAVAE